MTQWRLVTTPIGGAQNEGGHAELALDLNNSILWAF